MIFKLNVRIIILQCKNQWVDIWLQNAINCRIGLLPSFIWKSEKDRASDMSCRKSISTLAFTSSLNKFPLLLGYFMCIILFLSLIDTASSVSTKRGISCNDSFEFPFKSFTLKLYQIVIIVFNIGRHPTNSIGDFIPKSDDNYFPQTWQQNMWIHRGRVMGKI